MSRARQGFNMILCLVLLSAGPALARSYRFGTGSLVIEVPDDWADRVERSADDRPPTIHLSSASGDGTELTIAVFRTGDGGLDLNDSEQLRSMVISGGLDQMAGAREELLTLEELNGPFAHGYFYTLTQWDPFPGKHPFGTQGALILEDLVLIFTILAHERTGPALTGALSMLKEARWEEAQPEGPPEVVRPRPEVVHRDGELVINETGGYSLRPSDGWTLQESSTGVTVEMAGGEARMRIVFREESPDLESVMQRLRLAAPFRGGQSRIVRAEAGELGGEQARVLIVERRSGEEAPVQERYTVAVHAGRTYVVESTCPLTRVEELRPAFEAMERSFSFQDPRP